MNQRIYVVKHKPTGKVRMVEAYHPSAAMRHVVGQEFDVHVASTNEALELYEQGFRLERAPAKDAEDKSDSKE